MVKAQKSPDVDIAAGFATYSANLDTHRFRGLGVGDTLLICALNRSIGKL